MRMLFRLVILALAAVGAKTVYEAVASHKDQLRDTGTRLADRTTSAAQQVGTKLSSAATDVAQTAERNAADVSETAKGQLDEVKSAAQDAKDEVARELGSTSPSAPSASRS